MAYCDCSIRVRSIYILVVEYLFRKWRYERGGSWFWVCGCWLGRCCEVSALILKGSRRLRKKKKRRFLLKVYAHSALGDPQ